MMLGELLDKVRASFAGKDDADLVARLIVADATGRNASTVAFHGEMTLTAGQLTTIRATADRVLAGEPVFRALGHREFHGLDLALSPETLEPRDDTEALVDAALALIQDRLAILTFADLGTGTGAVALALLAELPNARALATDVSKDALATARSNARSNGLDDRFTAARGSWLEPLANWPPLDLIVSNPPYIASRTVDTLDPSVRNYDPRIALDGGSDGLDAYRTILDEAALHLTPQGFLALEIGYDQRAAVSALALGCGWKDVRCTKDLAGRDRALTMRHPSSGTNAE